LRPNAPFARASAHSAFHPLDLFSKFATLNYYDFFGRL
jgi:hypothetical protein